jgi:hypothetical protein
LYYYAEPKGRLCGEINVTHCLHDDLNLPQKTNCNIFDFPFTVITPTRTWPLCAPTVNERMCWTMALATYMDLNNRKLIHSGTIEKQVSAVSLT